jgi:hypothetical protein
MLAVDLSAPARLRRICSSKPHLSVGVDSVVTAHALRCLLLVLAFISVSLSTWQRLLFDHYALMASSSQDSRISWKLADTSRHDCCCCSSSTSASSGSGTDLVCQLPSSSPLSMYASGSPSLHPLVVATHWFYTSSLAVYS